MKYVLYCALAASLLPAVPPLMQSASTLVSTSDTTYTVQGRVTDRSTGQGLPGVTVFVKGTTIGVSTNQDGTYSIQVPKQAKFLAFNNIGFIQHEIKLKGQTIINVRLVTNSRHLKEVVVDKVKSRSNRPVPSHDRKQRIGRVVGNADAPADLAGLEPSEAPSLQGTGAGVAIVRGYTATAQPEPGAGESYATIAENGFRNATKEPLSTFSIDVDAASYSNVRRFLQQGQLPPADAVRTEELINYFQYNYPQPEPTASEPFRVLMEQAQCPWNPEHQLVQVALQGRKVPTEKLPPANLVFLVDVSGSMQGDDRLGLVQQALRLLTKELRPQDKVALVVYAGAAGTVLPPTAGTRRADILAAIDRLEAGGSTAGGAGLRLAYQVARENFNKEGNNRVILCTDGDFNVGEQSDQAMERLITEERESGVFLTVLGVGQGNY